MPSTFTTPKDVAEARGMGVLAICGERSDYPALKARLASRFWYWVSESGESGSEGAALAMTTPAEAADLMAQIRARYFQCRGATQLDDHLALEIESLTLDGDWEQAVAFVSEIVSTDPDMEPPSNDGTATVIAQRGSAIAVATYWIYFAQPVTGGEADELADELPAEVAGILDQLQ